VSAKAMDPENAMITKSSRENRVNQSGSVALSAEEVRGPPQRK
jgi:hypothetical protein